MAAFVRRTPDQQRRAELSCIHMAAAEINMADEAYRSMLSRITGLNSAKDMDGKQRQAVIDELRRLGARKATASANRAHFQRKFMGKPKNVAVAIEPLMRKVGALLADSGLPWAYAHAMAKRMHQVDKVEWLRPEQLHKLVAALSIAANRAKRKAAATGGGDAA